MQPYGSAPQPSPKRGMSALSIILIVLGVLAALVLGTCAAGVIWAKREVKKLEAELADGGAIVVAASPPSVVAELAGAKKAYVGSWSSARGSTLQIDADGAMKFEKDEDGDGTKEKINAPIAAFRGDDIEVKMLVTIFVKVTHAPHKVGSHWEMTADGVPLERSLAGGSATHDAAMSPSASGVTAQPDAGIDGHPAHGAVACGAKTCAGGTEKCCPELKACEPLQAGGSPTLCSKGQAYQCDRRSSCDPGEVCCLEEAEDGMWRSRCSAGPCGVHEACRGTSACAKGFKCKAPHDPFDPGECVVAAPHTKCGDTSCSGAKPVCVWGLDNKGHCDTDHWGPRDTVPGAAIYCSASSDCGTEHCCQSSLAQTYCEGDCGRDAFVCETIADCPPLHGGKRVRDCVGPKQASWPAWIKTCAYL